MEERQPAVSEEQQRVASWLAAAVSAIGFGGIVVGNLTGQWLAVIVVGVIAAAGAIGCMTIWLARTNQISVRDAFLVPWRDRSNQRT